MFGHIQANLADLSQEEKDRYRSCYCGLCRSIGKRHGFLARLGLNYDLTYGKNKPWKSGYSGILDVLYHEFQT